MKPHFFIRRQIGFALLLGLLFLFYINYQSLSAQETPILDQLSKDTTQAQVWKKVGDAFQDSSNCDSALWYYLKASSVYENYTNDNDDISFWTAYLVCENEIGNCYWKSGEYKKSLSILNNTLVVGKKYLGGQHIEIANTYNRIGVVYFIQNDYEKALSNYGMALKIRSVSLEEEHPDVIMIYNNMGLVYMNQGHYNKALTNFNKVLSIRLASLGKDHLKVASSYHKIGDVYLYLNLFNKALANYEKALTISLASLGEDNSSVADLYNNMGLVYNELGNFEKAFDYHKKTLAIRINIYGEKHQSVAASYNNIGLIKESQGAFEIALSNYQKSLEIESATLGEKHPEVAISYNNVGSAFLKLGFYEDALESFQKALKIRLSIYREEHPSIALSYNNLGIVYINQGANEMALNYLQKSLAIGLSVFGEKHLSVASSYNNIGLRYRVLGDYDEALNNLETALKIKITILGENHPDVAAIYNDIGLVYGDQRAFKASLENFHNALKIKSETLGKHHPDIGSHYQNIGYIFSQQGAYEEALKYLQKALTIRLGSLKEKHPAVSGTYNGIGHNYRQIGNYKYALRNFQKALMANSPVFNQQDLSKNPVVGELVLSKLKLLEALNGKARTLYDLYAYQSKQIDDLILAVETYKTSIQWANEMRKDFNREEDKEELLNNAFETYENAIKSSIELYGQIKQDSLLKQIFIYFEMSRSVLLLEGIQNTTAKAFSRIPSNLLKKENEISVLLTFYEKNLFEEELKEAKAESRKMALWQERIFALKQVNDSLTSVFETQYPEYHRLKYDLSAASVADVQTFLSDDKTALIEYFVGDSSIYAFVIDKNKYKLINIARDFPLETTITQLVKVISSANTSQRDSLAKLSHHLYQKIFAPIEKEFDLPEKLIIVPDGILGYLPFDALLKELPEPNSPLIFYPYLLKDHQISYCYSATLLKEMQERKHDEDQLGDFLAFAPEFNGDKQAFDESRFADLGYEERRIINTRAGLGFLEHNILEVETLGEIVGGSMDIFTGVKLYTGKAATRDQFLDNCTKYRILHLSSHANANDKQGDYSWIAFYKKDTTDHEFLYNRDLYNLQLKADLVVLSACETGIGELQRGEGIIGLTRGFSYAGAKSLLPSLWQVNDRSTRELMEQFYINLKAGKSKDEALRIAKLQLLSNNEYADPFHWAGFVPIGDMRPLKFSNITNWAIWIGIILFLLLIGVVINFRNNTKPT